MVECKGIQAIRDKTVKMIDFIAIYRFMRENDMGFYDFFMLMYTDYYVSSNNTLLRASAASRLLGINRVHCVDILKRLLDKGLIFRDRSRYGVTEKGSNLFRSFGQIKAWARRKEEAAGHKWKPVAKKDKHLLRKPPHDKGWQKGQTPWNTGMKRITPIEKDVPQMWVKDPDQVEKKKPGQNDKTGF